MQTNDTTSPSPDGCLGRAQVARLLAVHPNTVTKMHLRGAFPASRQTPGRQLRIPIASIDAARNALRAQREIITEARVHGGARGYWYAKGCRCEACCAAQHEVSRARHAARPPGESARRAARARREHPDRYAYWAWWSRSAREAKRLGYEGAVPRLFSLDEYGEHVEARFLPGMTWQNYGKGGWHNDHILPIGRFHLASVGDDQWLACCGLDNLRPMWGRANYRKSDRIVLADGTRAERCVVVKLPDGMTIEQAVAMLTAHGGRAQCEPCFETGYQRGGSWTQDITGYHGHINQRRTTWAK